MPLALESDGELVHKRNVSSAVWNYFGFSPDRDGKPENEEVAICRLSRKNVSSKASNTSNLFSHLRSHHPKEYSTFKEVKAPTKRSATNTSAIQPTISDAFALATKYNRSSKKWKELTDVVTRCIAKEMVPIYTVEKEGFRQMLMAFDSRYTCVYQLPSRHYFSRTAIPTLYTQVRGSVIRDLQQAQFYVATTDLWSSVTVEPYISFTVHYVHL